jgi:tetratricopeptide (TPR) repeat protein
MVLIALAGGVFAWENYQKQQTLAEVETLVARYLPAEEADAPGPGARRSLKEAITSIAQGAATDPRRRKALDLLKAGRPAEAEPLLKAVAEDMEKRAAKQYREAAEDYRTLAAIARISDPAKARTYYAKAAGLDPGNLEGLYRHGEMQKEAGALDAAEAAFRKIVRNGKEGRDDWALYWARLGLGDLRVARGNLKGAKAEFTGAQDFAKLVAAADPSNAGWQRDLTVSHNKIGDVLSDQGRLDEAVAAYRASLAIAEALAAADPSNAGWQYDLGISNERIGDVLMAQGRLDDALAAYQRRQDIIERLAAADPSNAGWQRDLTVSHNKIGDVLVAQGDLPGALESYRASMAIAERLAKSDPNNAGWQRDLTVSQDRIGDVLVAQGDLPGALESYRASMAIAERLAKSDPNNAGWQRDLAWSRWRLAQYADRPRVHWQEVVRILKGLEAEGRLAPTDRKWLPIAEQNLAGSP